MQSLAQSFVNNVPKVSLPKFEVHVDHHVGNHVDGERSLFTMSDNQIMDLIYETHVHHDENFDVASLFSVTENIVKHSTQIVDNIVQGTHVHGETIDEKPPKASFSSPLCTLKSIGCEMSCNAPGEEIAHKSTLAILKKLSTYSWEAKAVLALAAFSLEYGDFWLLAQTQQSDPLAKSVAILKRVPVLLKSTELQKRRKAVFELNDLIKTTLQVIEFIFELDKFSNCPPKDVPEYSTAIHEVPVNVYWSIITIVACATKVNLLTSDEEKPHDLSQFSQKIHYILNKLKVHLVVCNKQIDATEAFRKINKLFETPTEVMENIRALISSKDKVQPIIDGSNTTVNIDVFRKKNVLLFISSLDISDDDISDLKPVYEGITKEDYKGNYKIVWIPIVDQWTDEVLKKFEGLRAKMPWYTVQSFAPNIAAIRFIKETWNFKGMPAVVVLNPQGKVTNPNAFHLIRTRGMDAFPFTLDIPCPKDWLPIDNLDQKLDIWIKEDKYIFLYGGKANDWIDHFNKKATVIANDPFIKDSKINIELFNVGTLGRFWNKMQSLFFANAHKQTDIVTKEIQKLISYNYDSGWAVLVQGRTMVLMGYGSIILKVVNEFDAWKNSVKEKGFKFAFAEHYKKVIQNVRPPCSHVDIPSAVGTEPETLTCAFCQRTMEKWVSYKCCHNAPMNAHH